MAYNLDIKKGFEVILSEDIGDTYRVYNGKEYVKVFIEVAMVGYKYGEFIVTRKKPRIKRKDKKERVKKKS